MRVHVLLLEKLLLCKERRANHVALMISIAGAVLLQFVKELVLVVGMHLLLKSG